MEKLFKKLLIKISKKNPPKRPIKQKTNKPKFSLALEIKTMPSYFIIIKLIITYMLVNPAIAYENFEFIGKRSLIKKVIIKASNKVMQITV